MSTQDRSINICEINRNKYVHIHGHPDLTALCLAIIQAHMDMAIGWATSSLYIATESRIRPTVLASCG